MTGLDGYFEKVMGYDDCVFHKPDPRCVIEGCKSMSLNPEECVYVGDSPFDMHAGMGAGCICIGVLWGMFSEKRLIEEKPDHIVGHPKEIIEILDLY